MSILIGHYIRGLCSLTEIFLSVLEGLLAEYGKTLVEVLHGKDDAWTARQSVDFRTSVPQTCYELLYVTQFVDNIKMA